MPIIQPSIKFEGSEVLDNPSPYLDAGVPKAIFSKKVNPEGAYLYFLPAYRADNYGNGVWYKRITIRADFGTNYKEKYYVPNRSEDPAEYFANNFRHLYPEEAQPTTAQKNGKAWKQYPHYGRVTDRVIFNVAFAQAVDEGMRNFANKHPEYIKAHQTGNWQGVAEPELSSLISVLDLPLRNGADRLLKYLESKDRYGNPRKPINAPDSCVPVRVQLLDNSTNPWVIEVDGDGNRLPPSLCDSDNLHNLDDILIVKPKQEIIAKLREMYSSDVFDECMNGYPGLTNSSAAKPGPSYKKQQAVSSHEDDDNIDLRPSERTQNRPRFMQLASAESEPQPQAALPARPKAPAFMTQVPQVEQPQAVTAVNPPPAADIDDLPSNPISSGGVSRKDALRFLDEE